jgi:F-type H+-transporting ATPase subunit b
VKRAAVLAAALLVSVAPIVAGAAEVAGGAEDAHHGSSLWHYLNLALIVGAIVYFARTPIRTYMAERRQSIEAGLIAAQRELDEAQHRLAECNARVAALDREVESIQRAVRTQAEQERDRLLADARAAAERIRRDAGIAVEQEARRAMDQLRDEAAEMAVRLAGELLARQVTDADRARLVDEFVERVETSPAAAARS